MARIVLSSYVYGQYLAAYVYLKVTLTGSHIVQDTAPQLRGLDSHTTEQLPEGQRALLGDLQRSLPAES